MTRKRVGFDVDDVLAPWYDRAHELCVAAGITNGIVPVTWRPYEEYGCDADAWTQVVQAMATEGHYATIEPDHAALRELKRLWIRGYEIHLVTARGCGWPHSERIQADTQAWVDRHVRNFVDSLTFSKDKTVVDVDYFIDDHLKNYDALDAAGVHVFLLNRPWNQEPGDSRRRVDTVREFANHIIGRTA